MPANFYHFITDWRVPGTVAEVAEILGDAPGLARWWPSVYLKVTPLAAGDERGLGIWTFTQDGPDVLVKYNWKILAEKPLLRDLSFIMKPIFGANHRWAMARARKD